MFWYYLGFAIPPRPTSTLRLSPTVLVLTWSRTTLWQSFGKLLKSLAGVVGNFRETSNSCPPRPPLITSGTMCLKICLDACFACVFATLNGFDMELRSMCDTFWMFVWSSRGDEHDQRYITKSVRISGLQFCWASTFWCETNPYMLSFLRAPLMKGFVVDC